MTSQPSRPIAPKKRSRVSSAASRRGTPRRTNQSTGADKAIATTSREEQQQDRDHDLLQEPRGDHRRRGREHEAEPGGEQAGASLVGASESMCAS